MYYNKRVLIEISSPTICLQRKLQVLILGNAIFSGLLGSNKTYIFSPESQRTATLSVLSESMPIPNSTVETHCPYIQYYEFPACCLSVLCYPHFTLWKLFHLGLPFCSQSSCYCSLYPTGSIWPRVKRREENKMAVFIPYDQLLPF